VSPDCADYPEGLRSLAPPPALRVRGEVPRGPAIAIVGTRTPSEPARDWARAAAEALSRRGLVVWSGGAVGVDAAAHEGALDAGAPTVVVLGSGLDAPFPPQNRELFDRIPARGGGLVAIFDDHEPQSPSSGAASRAARPRSSSPSAAIDHASVRLVEMKPRTSARPRRPAITSPSSVCSNSLRGAALRERGRLAPEGGAAARGLARAARGGSRTPRARGRRARGRSRALRRGDHAARIADAPEHPLEHEEVTRIPDERPVILATGPLTRDALAAHLGGVVGGSTSPTTTRSRRSSRGLDRLGQGVEAVALRQGRRVSRSVALATAPEAEGRGARRAPDYRGPTRRT
jgi:hypothetical protein